MFEVTNKQMDKIYLLLFTKEGNDALEQLQSCRSRQWVYNKYIALIQVENKDTSQL